MNFLAMAHVLPAWHAAWHTCLVNPALRSSGRASMGVEALAAGLPWALGLSGFLISHCSCSMIFLMASPGGSHQLTNLFQGAL